MNSRIHRGWLAALLLATLPVAGRAAAPRAPASADVPPPEQRRPAVELALKLAAAAEPAHLASDLVNPFNPVKFGQPDPEELRAIALAHAAVSTAAAQAKPTTDRQLLEVIAGRILPSGILVMGGEPLLIFGQKRLHVGDRLTVTYDGHDYPLELTGIERTSFTLRLNRDEITRPIKSGKKP